MRDWGVGGGGCRETESGGRETEVLERRRDRGRRQREGMNE